MTLEYIRHPNKKYRNNPFIEVMGYPLTVEQFNQKISKPFESDIDLSNTPAELHGYYARTEIDNLADVYVVKDEAYRLYDKIRRMIEAGYIHRNPAGPSIRKLLGAIDESKYDPLNSLDIREVNVLRPQLCTFICGLSGIGKTKMIRTILGLMKQVHKHDNYVDSEGRIHQIEQKQITHLYVEIHERQSQRDVLKNIIAELDLYTDEKDKEDYTDYNRNELITLIRKKMTLHGVGLLIVDEAQNIEKPSTSDTLTVSTEKPTMKFIEDIFNRIGVPLCFLGTHSMLKVFGDEATIARRVAANGGLILGSCGVDSLFWKKLIKEMCPTQLLSNQKTSLETLTHHIHDKTAGIPAIATSLISVTLCYLTFLPAKEQDLSKKVINHIFDEQFQLLKRVIYAIKKEKYHLFSDLEYLAILEEVGDKESNAESTAMSVIEKHEKRALTGELKIKKLTDTDEREAQVEDVCDDIKPSNVLSSLGYDVS